MKYKVGDKVRVKSLDWYNANKNKWGSVPCISYSFIKEMSKLCGKLVVIKSITKLGYRINEYDYIWSDDMFEKDVNNEIRIEVPEGYIIDEENSTFECIKFKKKEEIKITCCLGSIRIKVDGLEFHILDIEDYVADFKSANRIAELYDAKLPTIKQLKVIYKYLDFINKYLNHPIKLNAYWTCEEKDSSYAWRVSIGSGGSSYAFRNSVSSMRPIINL